KKICVHWIAWYRGMGEFVSIPQALGGKSWESKGTASRGPSETEKHERRYGPSKVIKESKISYL
ncbi:MAG: hypothetical protein P8X74_23980, partial [Reinekea sp.]